MSRPNYAISYAYVNIVIFHWEIVSIVVFRFDINSRIYNFSFFTEPIINLSRKSWSMALFH